MNSKTKIKSNPGEVTALSNRHQVIQAALSSLDVDLEDELTRYRKSRSNRPATFAKEFKRTPKTTNTEVIGTQPIQTSHSNLSTPEDQPMIHPPVDPAASISFDVSQKVTSSVNPPISSPSNPNNPLIPPSAPIPTQSAQSTQPNDYLNSSEELIKSLEEESEEDESPNNMSFLDHLLTPLGVGSLLLFLLSTATLSYVLQHNNALKHLNIGKLLNLNTPTPIPTQTNPPPQSQNTVIPANPNGPNLAAEEFIDLNINNLSQIRPNLSQPTPKPTPQVTQKPAAAVPPATPNPTNRNLAEVLLPPQITPPTGTISVPKPLPQVPQVPQVPNTTNPPNNPNIAAVPNNSDYYYILSPYQNSRSLERARAIAPDAYVGRFPEGLRIFMGAYQNQAQAQAVVQQLKQKGINATIFKP